MATSPPIICILLLSSSSARLGAMETPQTPPVCNDKFLDASGIWESCSKVCGNLILGGSIDSLHNTNCKLLCQDCFDHYARRTTSTTQLVTTRSGISISDISISEYDVWKWKTTAIVMIAAFSTVLIANIIAISVYRRCQQGSTENPPIRQQDAEAQRNSGSSSPASGQNHSAGNATARAQAHAHGPSRIPVVANGRLVSMQGHPIAPCTGDAANGGTLPETSACRIEGNNSVNDNGHPEAPRSSGGDQRQTMAHIHSMPLERIHPLEENSSYDSNEAETHFIEENVSIENDENSATPNSDDAGYTSAHTPSERSPLIEENINDSQSE